MSDRETKKITTPITNTEVQLKTWISGREELEINSVFTNDTVFKQDEGVGIQGSKFKEAKIKKIEMVVVSVNGETENVIDKVLDLPSKDYRFISDEIDKITDDKEDDEDKKK